MRCASSFCVCFDPFIQCKRCVIGIHAETVDHLAGECIFSAVPAGSFLLLCQRQRLFHKPLVPGVVDVAVQHVGFGIPVFVEQILPVVAQDRIVAEHNLSAVVMKLRIGADPLKAGGVVALRASELVVISLDQIQKPV